MALKDDEKASEKRTHSDFTALQIEPEMLDRPH
jgi:hypothetical protein